MVPILVFATVTAFFAVYLRWRSFARTLPEALALAAIAGGVWGWFILFRLSSGGLFADGGAAVWSVLLFAVCATIVRRALKAQAARL